MCERSEGDTRTHTPAHTGVPRGEGKRGAGRGGEDSAPRRPRSHAWAPEVGGGGGRTVLCFSPLAALEAPRHQSLGHQLINTAHQAGEERARSKARVSPLEPKSRPAAGPDLLHHCPSIFAADLTLRESGLCAGSWGFCKPLPLPSGDVRSQEKKSNPLLQVPKLRPRSSDLPETIGPPNVLNLLSFL